MKKFSFLFLFSCIFLNAQQSELVSNIWYLESVSDEIHEGNVYPPVNEEMSQITFEFYQENGEWYFLTGACAPISAKISDFENDAFFYSDLECCEEGEMCTLPENQEFEQLYISYFNQIPDPGLFYFINENPDGSLSLYMGTQIFQEMNFRNVSLSVQDVNDIEQPEYLLNFHDNELVVQNQNQTPAAASVEIYDLSGKRIFENNSLSSQRIQVGNLPKSIYIVRIRDSEGRIFSKKLRKN
ncbi:MAG: T9SS type A sorting domain-containing protein [Weeksellaceae bacterium]